MAVGQIPVFDADLDIIQKLDDEPNDVGGLTSSELKAKFDEAGNTIKDWLNGQFIGPANNIVDGINMILASTWGFLFVGDDGYMYQRSFDGQLYTFRMTADGWLETVEEVEE